MVTGAFDSGDVCDGEWRIVWAGVTQLVECDLAKVDVAGSNPVSRSKAITSLLCIKQITLSIMIQIVGRAILPADPLSSGSKPLLFVDPRHDLCLSFTDGTASKYTTTPVTPA